MIRVMAWNIERFGLNKLMTNDWDVTEARQQFITSTVGNVDPDVFIVIEVQTNAHNAFGGIISDTSGAPGIMALLMHLVDQDAAANWSLVPPLIISPGGGYSEGIAVFYKSSVLNFQGPMMWNGVTAQTPQLGNSVAYGGLWAFALPNRASGVPGFNENTLAGQFAFWNGLNLVTFPDANGRPPWCTQFNVIATGRKLRLFSVHFPPTAYRAGQAFAQLANVAGITAALTPTEDRIVLGDFNLNSLNPAQAAAFTTLTAPAAGPAYVQLLNTPTMLKSVMKSSTVGAAPYYKYAQQDNAGNRLGLDNAFVARGGVVAAPAAVAGNSVVGTLPDFPRDLAISIPNIIAALPPGGARAARFRALDNFGHIGGKRGTSDHMAFVVDLP